MVYGFREGGKVVMRGRGLRNNQGNTTMIKEEWIWEHEWKGEGQDKEGELSGRDDNRSLGR